MVELRGKASNIRQKSMRVGSEYQAVVPDKSTVLPKPAPDYEPEHAVLVWSPTNDIPEDRLDSYILLAKEKYNYNMEQALGMLCWHKFDLEKALADLPNFTPFPDEWTVEDKVLFEQAFQFHDKHFHKIKQMLPDKAIASLVKYYYSWKKTRSRTSLMDRQARRLTIQKDDGSDAASDGSSDNESEANNESNKQNENGESNVQEGKPRCENCFTTASGQFHNTSKGVLCRACYSYWRRTGMMRNMNAVRKHEPGSTRHNPMKSKRKPPRGIYLNLEDLTAIAGGPAGQGEALLKALDSEVINLKRAVQNNKQIISQLKHKTSVGINEFRPAETTQRINARWTQEENLLAVQGVRKYGKDFKAIGEVIGTKTEAHVRTFFLNNERRYQLNNVLKEYEEENGITHEESEGKESKKIKLDEAAASAA
ncbi:REST corepressor 1-like protein [Dinothrombium tinctorium]|uniref:REST corepressor 1-like protein n=1 Tax=Dinothrombium tinctorium TaxID=1965070 RepID=A0A3S3RTA2_9ACAR|nr:REST corepressor 1-like protein [Dinothrombium tinctorium]